MAAAKVVKEEVDAAAAVITLLSDAILACGEIAIAERAAADEDPILLLGASPKGEEEEKEKETAAAAAAAIRSAIDLLVQVEGRRSRSSSGGGNDDRDTRSVQDAIARLRGILERRRGHDDDLLEQQDC